MTRLNPSSPVIAVGICGGSASGKTWLADRLAECLPGAVRLSVDSFYRDRSHLPAGRRARLNFDHPRAIDWAALESCLERLRARQTCRVPGYDFVTHARQTEGQVVPSSAVVILDGLWLFRRPTLRKLMDFRVFLECPGAVRLARRLERDVRERGRNAEDVQRQFHEHVEPMHRRFVEPQLRHAGIRLAYPLPGGAAEKLADMVRERAGGLA